MVRVESRLWTLWLVPLPGLAFLLLLLVPEDQREGEDGVVVLLALVFAGRLREGGPYDVPGPAIAGWRCRPIGRVQPDALHDLAELAWRHGVTWRDAPAPRSCDGAVVRRGAERCRRTGRVPGGTGGGPPVQRADQPPSSMKEEPLAKDATSEHR